MISSASPSLLSHLPSEIWRAAFLHNSKAVRIDHNFFVAALLKAVSANFVMMRLIRLGLKGGNRICPWNSRRPIILFCGVRLQRWGCPRPHFWVRQPAFRRGEKVCRPCRVECRACFSSAQSCLFDIISFAQMILARPPVTSRRTPRRCSLVGSVRRRSCSHQPPPSSAGASAVSSLSAARAFSRTPATAGVEIFSSIKSLL